MRLLLVLASCLVLGLPAQSLAGDRYALLVGVRQYDKSELSPLEYTENDVTVLAEYLKASGYKRVVLMTQSRGAVEARYLPTAANIRKELKGLLDDRRADDTVVLAFCGHGVQFRGSDEPFFCPMDASLKTRSTLLSLGEVYGQLARCKAKTKVLFSDACRNDPLPRGTRAALSKEITVPRTSTTVRAKVPENVVALFSCSANEVAWETATHKHGVFFYYLIKGLEGSAANSEDQVTIASLVDYVQKNVNDFVKDKISATAKQRPELFGRFNAPVVIADVTQSVKQAKPKTVAQASSKGREFIRERKYKEAVVEASRGLKADPKHAFLLAMRAHARERLGDAKNAMVDADKATQLDQKLGHPYHTRGCVYLYLHKQPLKAITEFTAAIERSPRDTGSYFGRAIAYSRTKQNAKAIEDFTEAIRLDPEFGAAYRERARLILAEKDSRGAMKDLEMALSKNPKDAFALADRGWIKYRWMRDRAGALVDFEEALKHNDRLAKAYHGRGAIRLEQKEIDRALADLTKALEYDATLVEALVARGHALFSKGDHRTALADANAAIKLDPKHALAYNNRGACYSHLKKFDLAITDYTRAIELNPNVPLYWTNRAKSHRALKHTREAEADEAKAKSLQNTHKLLERTKS